MHQEDKPLIIDGSSGSKELERHVARVLAEYFELWKKKQHDYGPGNISAFGELGCLIRANDKINRLRTLLYESKEPNAVEGETVRDAWSDLIGYGILGTLCFDGNWPGVPANPASDNSVQCCPDLEPEPEPEPAPEPAPDPEWIMDVNNPDLQFFRHPAVGPDSRVYKLTELLVKFLRAVSCDVRRKYPVWQDGNIYRYAREGTPGWAEPFVDGEVVSCKGPRIMAANKHYPSRNYDHYLVFSLVHSQFKGGNDGEN